jgi:hypothetical protein
MKKINRYAESSTLMKIRVEHNGESFEFNLFEELQINESIISKEIKQQPNSYAFLSMLQVQLSYLRDKSKVNEEKIYDKLYTIFKARTNKQTGRPNPDDVAKALAGQNDKYIKARNKTLSLSKQLGTISNCVKAFEQRSSLLQTLSANKRREQN